MSELQSLTKTLIQVVGSLQDLLNKKGNNTSIGQSQKPVLKKTPQMTYNDFLKRALSTKQPIEVNSKKASYKLQEDLELLYQLSSKQQISLKTFEAISKSKKINRSAQSLRNRYHQVLYKIDQKQMKKIVAWIERQGVEGFIIFQNQQIKLQLNDPNDDKKRQKTIQTQGRKQIKKPKGISLPSNCKQLNQILSLYSKLVNVPISSLLQTLDQLNGDLALLDVYIECKDARMLWTQQQDQILRRGDKKQIQLLKKYRGGQSVETRKKYIGL